MFSSSFSISPIYSLLFLALTPSCFSSPSLSVYTDTLASPSFPPFPSSLYPTSSLSFISPLLSFLHPAPLNALLSSPHLILRLPRLPWWIWVSIFSLPLHLPLNLFFLFFLVLLVLPFLISLLLSLCLCVFIGSQIHARENVTSPSSALNRNGQNGFSTILLPSFVSLDLYFSSLHSAW